MSRRKAHPSSPRKIGKHIIMWGLILCAIVTISLGIREIPALDPREYVGRNSNRAIELWVELRDQHDRPLVQHPVEVHLVQWHNGPKRETEMKTTDDQGRLHLVGRNHCGISLELDPEVYLPTHLMARWYTSPFATNLREGMYRTDWGTAEEPTICRVLRKEGPQPLVEIWGSVSFPYRGDEPVYLDLQKAEVTMDRSRGDVAIRISLGDMAVPAVLPENPHVPVSPDFVPGCVHYPHKTMWVEAVDGWIEEIPRDFNWYRRYVHGALSYQPAAVRPNDLRAGDYGAIVEQAVMFTSRNNQLSGKGIMSVFITYGPEPDVMVLYRGVINPTGSKSFEFDAGSLPVRKLTLDTTTITIDRQLRPSAREERQWDDVFPHFSLTRNPDPVRSKR